MKTIIPEQAIKTSILEPQQKLEPCITPLSPEARRIDQDEDACDDGVQ